MTKMLRGKISVGMFPDEKVVTINDSSGIGIVLVASASLISGDSVRVQVIDSQDGKSLVLLPGDVLGSGRTVTVRDTELAEIG